MALVAKHIMIKDIICISEDSSTYEAIEILVSSEANCIHVLNSEGLLVGIVTETDLVYVDKKLNASVHYAYTELDVQIDTRALNTDLDRFKSIKIKDVMTTKLVTVKEDTPLEKIIDIIINKGIKTIPVVRDSKVIGMISRKNILKYYLR
ncbi:CBS-domain-containing membrane protein [Clostridium aceticum]|uniref:CBS-domain-containing membrane protein n=1 Tax=Clostridium aceticum TaxID=84022 RepID=A0A0D8ICY8_9CLOT|nr:CBS domain-containing protein [Clostridium aceticum]AKL95997.1 CBS-domain-containing membrane protein [Clostridium aceticum]KJF27061.1 hypothetical protein TZ02_09675 [Clostridium aceticum]